MTTIPDRLLSQLAHVELISPNPERSARFHDVLLIGDAAHATTPHLAMGACIAIEDAVVLGEELGASEDLTTALETFMTRRFERCRLVVDNSLQLGEWEKAPNAPGADPVGLTDDTQAAMAVPF